MLVERVLQLCTLRMFHTCCTVIFRLAIFPVCAGNGCLHAARVSVPARHAGTCAEGGQAARRTYPGLSSLMSLH